jgi:hypothetical protein
MISGGSMPKETAKNDEEDDVTTAQKGLYVYTQRAGVSSKIKRGIRRRQRHNKDWKNG